MNVTTTTGKGPVGVAGFPALLIDAPLLSRSDISLAEQPARREQMPLADAVVPLGFVREEDAYAKLAEATTCSSPFWHLPNPDVKPQPKQTVEAKLIRQVGPNLSLSGSAFYPRFTSLIKPSDADQAYAGFYHGWPVAYIDFPVNEGRETTYGGTLQFEAMKSFGLDRQVAAHAGRSLADGRVRRTLDDIRPST